MLNNSLRQEFISEAYDSIYYGTRSLNTVITKSINVTSLSKNVIDIKM